MKGRKVLIFSLVLLFSLSFASAGIFDFLTGKASIDEYELGGIKPSPINTSCATEGSWHYENRFCDYDLGENAQDCPNDCFVVGDGLCSIKAGEDRYGSREDCTGGIVEYCVSCAAPQPGCDYVGGSCETCGALVCEDNDYNNPGEVIGVAYSCYDNGEVVNRNKMYTDIVENIDTKADYCEGSSLVDYYCIGEYISKEIIACPNGCIDGACLEEKEKSIDCYAKVNDEIVKMPEATDRNECYYKISYGRRNCEVYDSYFKDGENLLELYFGENDKIISQYCEVEKEEISECLTMEPQILTCGDYDNEADCNTNECGIGKGTDRLCAWYDHENVSYCGTIVTYSPMCGDMVCDVQYGENYDSCPMDCPYEITCGNGVCEASESATTCSADCGTTIGTCYRNSSETSDCINGFKTYDIYTTFQWKDWVPTSVTGGEGYVYDSRTGKYYYDPDEEFAACIPGTEAVACENNEIEVIYCKLGEECSLSFLDIGYMDSSEFTVGMGKYRESEGSEEFIDYVAFFVDKSEEVRKNEGEWNKAEVGEFVLVKRNDGTEYEVEVLNIFYDGSQDSNVIFVANKKSDYNPEGVSCNGCFIDEKCYDYGHRKSEEFCSASDGWIIQQEAESMCDNNFECSSNLCVDSKCVDGSMWQKLMELFSKFFGN